MSRPAKKDSGKGNIEWTRNELIEAAAKQFAKWGFEGASLSKIRELVDVKNSTIHYHFGSKQGLYDAVTRRLEESLAALIEELQQHADAAPMERLCICCEKLQAWVNNQQDFTAIVIQEMMSKQIQDSNEAFYKALGNRLAAISEFLRGNDSGEEWREVQWEIYTVNLLLGILIGQGVSIAVPLTFGMSDREYQHKQLDDLITTQLLSLTNDRQKAIDFLQQRRPSCFEF